MRQVAMNRGFHECQSPANDMLGVGKSASQRAEALGGKGAKALGHNRQAEREQQSVQREQIEPQVLVLVERLGVINCVHHEVRDQRCRDCRPGTAENHPAGCPQGTVN